MSQKSDQKDVQRSNFLICSNNVLWKNFPILSYSTLLMHKKHYSVKIGSISYFSSSDMQKVNHLLGCHTISINSLFISCFSALPFSNLICQAKILI